jgi:hypothetical protein
MQASLDAQNRITAGRSGIAEGLLGRAGDELSQPTDWSKFTPMGMGPSSGADARNSAEQALYSRATSRLDPQWQQTTGNMDIQLRNQGLKPGDEAYDRAMQNTNMAKNDAYEAARTGAITGGGAEASRQQQMDLSSSNYQNMARQQQIAESLQKQGWSLNAINAAISGQQVGMPNMPNFAGAGSAQPTQYLPAAGMQYGGQMDQNNASQMNLGGMMSGAGSLFNGLGSLFGWGG